LNVQILSSLSFLQALENDASEPELSAIARHHLARYEFPVMMSVSTPDGTIVHTVNANNFLDTEKDVSMFEAGYVGVVHSF
jgi:hypothetical protein